MIQDPTFWDDEANPNNFKESSPLLSRGFRGYCEERTEDLLRRVHSWVDLLQARDIKVNSAAAKQGVEERYLRIFERDADRTWIQKSDPAIQARTNKRHAAQIECLKVAFSEVQDYNQSLGYVVALLQLFLEPEDIARVAVSLHRSDRHCSGYYNSEAQAFAADSFVFMELLTIKVPDVAQHLSSKGCVPNGYMVKWLSGLGVHCLSLRELLDYWEAFFQYGFEFTLAFGIAFMRHFRQELLQQKTTAECNSILRMEDSKGQWFFPSVLLEGSSQAELDQRLRLVIMQALEIVATEELGTTQKLQEMRLAQRAKVQLQCEKARADAERLANKYGNDDCDGDFSDED
jgi:hypothetical protein